MTPVSFCGHWWTLLYLESHIYEPKTKKNMKSEITLFQNVSEECVSERGNSLHLSDTVYRHARAARLTEFHENPKKARK